ncbi:MAG: ATP-binding protein [Acidimicrobiia bacterium]
MGALPTGTVTFLFTDIEGSTRLWDQHPEAMAVALERHDEIVRDVFGRHDGHVFATGGDGFGVVFQRAEQAVAVALEAQRFLASEEWDDECPIRVRIGVHSGETQERGGDFFGPTVNRCARIMAAARPTQILVSGITHDIINESGANDVGFASVGSAVLRGMADPMALWRVVAAGLPDIDEPLLQLDRSGNMVAPLTSFVGRRAELSGVVAALDQHRLVTLIGVGGVGKTRLAIEAALGARGHRDGVWLVELSLTDTDDDVAAALSDALRLQPTPGVGYDESVVEWCAARDLLVVLDNCEHVLRGAATLVKSLLTAAPQAKVLTTSREPLMIPGEHVVPVPSLSLEASPGELSDAVAFFAERARAELADFDVAAQADVVSDICARLDGIPLALELAAARVRGLSVQELSNRLDERFRLLTGGRSGSVERHATLRAAVDWSYDLLQPAEQDLFERLSVFAGRFGVDDAVGLRGDDVDEFDAIDTLAALVDRSLIVREDERPEYRMLETLRAYGRERLTLADRIDAVRADHAALMASKAKVARAESIGPGEAAVVARLEAQLPDYGAAAHWAIAAGQPALVVAIAADCLRAHWGANAEPSNWVAPLLQADLGGAPMSDVFWLAAHRAMFYEGSPLDAVELAGRSIALDPSNSMAYAQAGVAAILAGHSDTVVEHGRSALEHASDDAERALALLVLSHALITAGRPKEAAVTAKELEQLGASRQYPSAIASAQYIHGEIMAETDPDAALAAFRLGLDALQGANLWIQEAQLRRAMIPLLMSADRPAALRAAADFIELCDQRNDTGQGNNALAYLVTILHDLGDPELAARVVGRVGDPLLLPAESAQYTETREALRQELGDRYDQLTSGGESTSTTAVVSMILDALAPHR